MIILRCNGMLINIVPDIDLFDAHTKKIYHTVKWYVCLILVRPQNFILVAMDVSSSVFWFCYHTILVPIFR